MSLESSPFFDKAFLKTTKIVTIILLTTAQRAWLVSLFHHLGNLKKKKEFPPIYQNTKLMNKTDTFHDTSDLKNHILPGVSVYSLLILHTNRNHIE